MARKNLYINDISLGQYGIYISSDTVLNTPGFDYIGHKVPAKNGTILQYNRRLDNVIRKFTCYVPLQGNVQTAMTNVKKIIYANPGYLKITSDYEPDTYQLGYLSQAIEVRPFLKYKSVTFDLYFSCLPQKYFNVNQTYSGSTKTISRLRKIATRNYIGISQTFNNMPIDAIPADDTFCIFALGQRSKSATESTTISVTTSSPFIAIYSGWVKTPLLSDPDEFNDLIAYSTNGSISWSGVVTGRTYIIVPADYFDSIVGTDGSYSINTTPSSSLSVTNVDALGVSSNLKTTMTYNSVGDAGTLHTYLYGSSNGGKTFDALISFDVDKFNNDYGVSGVVELTIDAMTLEAFLWSAATGDIKASEYTSIEGNLSGIADSIDVVAYNVGDNLLNISTVRLNPAWWTL